MSLKINFLSVVGLAVAIGGFATVASAQEATTTSPKDSVEKREKFERRGGRSGEGFRGKHRGGQGGMLRGLHELNLTDAQKQQIHSILDSNKPDQATQEQMRTLGEAKRNGTITAEQQEQLKALRSQGREKMESVHQQILGVLTAEQRQQLEQKKADMQKRREERRQQRQTDKPAADKPTDN